METFAGNGVNGVYADAIHAIMAEGTEVPSRNGATMELHPAAFEIHHPWKRLVTAYGRPVNVAFSLAEVLWIFAGRSDVRMLKHYNSRISDYSDDGDVFNAPYGGRLRHQFGIDQIEMVIEILKSDKDSRQASLVISHPVYDRGFDKDANGEFTKHESKDRACNVYCHLMVRNGKLDWLQIVRSNDAMWGTPYNWMQFTMLQEYIATAVGIPMGKYVHVADSLHIYDYHWDEARTIKTFNIYDEMGLAHKPLMDASPNILHDCMATELKLRSAASGAELKEIFPPKVPLAWLHMLLVLKAHTLYRLKEDSEALDVLLSGDRIYGAAQIRFYYHHRWHKIEGFAGALKRSTDWPDSVIDWITSRAKPVDE